MLKLSDSNRESGVCEVTEEQGEPHDPGQRHSGKQMSTNT